MMQGQIRYWIGGGPQFFMQVSENGTEVMGVSGVGRATLQGFIDRQIEKNPGKGYLNVELIY